MRLKALKVKKDKNSDIGGLNHKKPNLTSLIIPERLKPNVDQDSDDSDFDSNRHIKKKKGKKQNYVFNPGSFGIQKANK